MTHLFSWPSLFNLLVIFDLLLVITWFRSQLLKHKLNKLDKRWQEEQQKLKLEEWKEWENKLLEYQVCTRLVCSDSLFW